jgi:hypothetical protein
VGLGSFSQCGLRFRSSASFSVVFCPALHYNLAMKFLPAVLFFLGLAIVGGYVYESHHRAHPVLTSKSSTVASPHSTVELQQRKQAIQTKLKAARVRAQPASGVAASPSLQSEINQLQAELNEADAEIAQSHQNEQPAPATSQQTKLVASVIFGVAGMFLILSKSVPDSQKTFGYGLLTMILGFWLHL